MKIIAIMTIASLMIPAMTDATIINIPRDFPTIQDGIEAAADGDTVMADPGRYFEEINFLGRNITVASRFIITGAPSDIFSTIIDGDSAHTVIRVENGEDSTASLVGFTITHGLGGNGGGVYCFTAAPVIANNIVTENYAQNGAGIYLGHSEALVRDNIVKNNAAEIVGGGIRCYFSEVDIMDNIIIKNVAVDGSGIACNNSKADISNNIVARNESGSIRMASTGIIIGYNSEATLLNNTITLNSADSGAALYCHSNSRSTVINTILWANTPYSHSSDNSSSISFSFCDFYGGEGDGNLGSDPLLIGPHWDNYNLCGQSPCIDAGDPDIVDPDGSRSDIGAYFPDHPDCDLGKRWHVAAAGDDIGGDGSMEFPFGTIQHGIDMARQGDSVIVLNGLYTENLFVVEKNIVIGSEYILSGDTLDIYNTVIDGDSVESCIYFLRCNSPSSIEGFSISSGHPAGVRSYNSRFMIRNNLISDNRQTGIQCNGSDVEISNNIIQRSGWRGIFCENETNAELTGNIIRDNNEGSHSGGVRIRYSSAILRNNLIYGNDASNTGWYSGSGGGLVLDGTHDILLMNNVFWGNIGRNGGGLSCVNSNPVIVNCILWSDSAEHEENEIYLDSLSSADIRYSDIMGSWEGPGNMDIDPMFRDTVNHDFRLMSTECGHQFDSPCIDTGDPAMLDSLVDCSWGLGTAISDMGAFGGGDSVQVGLTDREQVVPSRYRLAQNFPNPFNSSTTIGYELPIASEIKIEIFDILGRKVAIIVDGFQEAGYHRANWNAEYTPSGLYFYRIIAGDFAETGKMLLLR